MKPPRQFGPLPHVRYRPEIQHCIHCGAALRYSHPVWAKAVQFLTGPEQVTNLGWRCSNPACAFGRSVYRSARAEARQVKGSGYGLDVVVRIGYLRFAAHRTREEIWRELHEQTPVQLSERHVQNLLEVYLALLRASERDPQERLAATVDEHGGIILALDGLQPEQGNEQLWVVREVLSGTVLGAANLQQASAVFLARLLRPVREAGLPVLGVVSDAQESIRLAVAEVFPGVPHQLCQYHALREAAEPLWEADRHLLVEAKKELRGLRDVEERTRRPDRPEPTDPASAVVLDTVLALRQVVRERGQLPLAFAGLRVMDALGEVGATLDRCLLKKGMLGWPGSARWSAGPSSAAVRPPASCDRPIAGSARSRAAWSPPSPMPPSLRPPGRRCATASRAIWTSWRRR
jgi:Transposase, Mutator family